METEGKSQMQTRHRFRNTFGLDQENCRGRRSGRLPHLRPQVIPVSSSTAHRPEQTRSRHRSDVSVATTCETNPRLKSSSAHGSSSGSGTSFIDAMNRRPCRRQKRDARRARYEQAEKEKRCLATWREKVSESIAPEAARAGRLYLRRRKGPRKASHAKDTRCAARKAEASMGESSIARCEAVHATSRTEAVGSMGESSKAKTGQCSGDG